MPHHARPAPLILTALLLLAACTPSPDGSGEMEQDDRAAPVGGESANEETPADGEPPVCLRYPPFVPDGVVPLDASATGDAAQIAKLRWERHEGCERFVVALAGEDGAPATSAGEITAEVLRDLGVVRIDLRDVEAVDPEATDARFEGPLARAAYAVRSPSVGSPSAPSREGGWLYVDLHLGRPAEASMLVLSDPARVVVDLRPGGGALPAASATGRRVVVLEPRQGMATAYPLTVTGYARTFEANVVARLERSGVVVREAFTTATAWADVWGHYSITLPDGPQGPVTLHVGEHSARDGTWEGVAVELNLR